MRLLWLSLLLFTSSAVFGQDSQASGDDNAPTDPATSNNNGGSPATQTSSTPVNPQTTQDDNGNAGGNAGTSQGQQNPGGNGAVTSTSIIQQTVVVQPTQATPTQAAATSSQDTAGTRMTFSSIRGHSVVVVVANLTTTVAEELASSVASAASSSIAALQNGGQGNNSSSSSVKAWAIPLGVVGGLVLFGLIGFILWRLSKRNGGDSDDPIRWPEMKSSDYDDDILMPVGVHRTAGAGVGNEGDEDDAPQMRSVSPGMGLSMMGHSSSSHLVQQQPYYDEHGQQAYYDSFAMGEAYLSSGASQISRRPSNMSLGATSTLPPGAARSRTPVMDQAEQIAAYHAHPSVDEYYNSSAAEDSPHMSTPPADSPSSSKSLLDRSGTANLDRNGTLRSTHSMSSNQRLTLMNPDA